MMYAVEVQGDTAIRCIVGDADWAAANLGGDWLASEYKVGSGWIWDGNQFSPPYEPPSSEPILEEPA